MKALSNSGNQTVDMNDQIHDLLIIGINAAELFHIFGDLVCTLKRLRIAVFELIVDLDILRR